MGSEMCIRDRLEGAYEDDMSMMRDDLRSNNLIETDEPFSALGFPHSNGGGGESIENGVLNTTGMDAIVDWIFVRLEDENGDFYTRSALVQRDGDVVDMDGTSPVSFPDLGEGLYQVELRSKNHLSIRTAGASMLRAE